MKANNMKKIITHLFVLFLIFTSCDKNEEEYVQPNYLTGTWEIIEIGQTNAQGVILYEQYQNAANCGKDNLIFNVDSTFEANDYLQINGNCSNNKTSGTYTRKSTSVVLNYSEVVNGVPQQVDNQYSVVALTFDQIIINYKDKSTNKLIYLKLNKLK